MEELKKKPPGAGVKKEAAVHLPAGKAGGGRAGAAALHAAWLLSSSVLCSALSLPTCTACDPCFLPGPAASVLDEFS